MMVWLGIAVIVVSAVLSLRSTGSSSWASVGVLIGVILIFAGSCSIGPLTR